MNRKILISLLAVALLSTAAIGVVFFWPDDQASACDSVHDGAVTVSLDSSAVLAGPYARNRLWRLFNNNCERTNNESELEISMCVAFHRDTSHRNRCQALGYLIDARMINFPRARMNWMARGLASSPPDRVIQVTRMIATNNHRGRFLTELCADEARMTRFLRRQQIQLE